MGDCMRVIFATWIFWIGMEFLAHCSTFCFYEVWPYLMYVWCLLFTVLMYILAYISASLWHYSLEEGAQHGKWEYLLFLEQSVFGQSRISIYSTTNDTGHFSAGHCGLEIWDAVRLFRCVVNTTGFSLPT